MKLVDKSFYHFSEGDFTDIEVYSDEQTFKLVFWGKDVTLTREEALELAKNIDDVRWNRANVELPTITFSDGFELRMDFNTAATLRMRLLHVFNNPAESDLYRWTKEDAALTEEETLNLIVIVARAFMGEEL